MIDPTLPRSWSEATEALLAVAAQDLDAGGVPLPMLAAFQGDEPHAVVTLRPFGPDEVLQAFVEILSLLLPLGSDRLACSLPALAGSETDDLDLRGRALLLVTADGHRGRCETELALVPGGATPEGWRWNEPTTTETVAHAPLVAALGTLLDARQELVTSPMDGLRLAAQFGRVLLLGHGLALAPGLAQRLELASSA